MEGPCKKSGIVLEGGRTFPRTTPRHPNSGGVSATASIVMSHWKNEKPLNLRSVQLDNLNAKKPRVPFLQFPVFLLQKLPLPVWKGTYMESK